MPASTHSADLPFDPSATELLIVDDDPHLRESLSALLSMHGYQISTAGSGTEALHMLADKHYDLALLDLNLGDMSGLDVLQCLHETHNTTPVIVVSGETSFASASKALRRGAQDYLKKPFDGDEMLTTIANTLTKRILENSNLMMRQRLRQSEELHRYIVNSSPDIVYMLDAHGQFIFLNDKVEHLLGIRRDELLGQHYSHIIEQADWRRVDEFIDTQLTRESSGLSLEVRLRHHLKSQTQQERHFEITLFPIELGSNGLKPVNKDTSADARIGMYGTARDITERKEAEEFINFQAYHDLLTRLPNRALFKDRVSLAVSQARRNKAQLALMFLDLDRFKIVNDTLGHTMGDRLLQSVARRLESCLREGDTLSRFGGDEFTLLLPSIHSREDARNVAKKIISELREPFFLGEHEVFVGVSIGIALYPDDGLQVEQLVQNADIAMYHVKGRGKDGYQFFHNSMTVSTSNRLMLERDLRRALENHEFEVYYQPQVDVTSARIIGVEALVRWNHPEKGIVNPADFIPLAEETKMIDDIGDWVLRAACTEVGQWIANGHSDIRLSVNFSPMQVEHPRFVERLISTLEACQFPPRNLEIELTESVLMNDLELMVRKLNQLSQHQVTIAIDDFGTGYSSLSYLQKLPIHTLKVDQSFVREIQSGTDDACIVNAIIAMAKGLRLNIVAEGVESYSQLQYLQSLGCSEVQGFFFGKAQPAAATLALLDQSLSKAS